MFYDAFLCCSYSTHIMFYDIFYVHKLLRSTYPIFGLFDFFFQPEQCFSLTIIQPEQCFSASFSQVSDQRTETEHPLPLTFFLPRTASSVLTVLPPPLALPWRPFPKSPLYSSKPLGRTRKTDLGQQEEQEEVHLPCRLVFPRLFQLP